MEDGLPFDDKQGFRYKTSTRIGTRPFSSGSNDPNSDLFHVNRRSAWFGLWSIRKGSLPAVDMIVQRRTKGLKFLESVPFFGLLVPKEARIVLSYAIQMKPPNSFFVSGAGKQEGDGDWFPCRSREPIYQGHRRNCTQKARRKAGNLACSPNFKTKVGAIIAADHPLFLAEINIGTYLARVWTKLERAFPLFPKACVKDFLPALKGMVA